jgi:hypothetical protein
VAKPGETLAPVAFSRARRQFFIGGVHEPVAPSGERVRLAARPWRSPGE